MDFERFLTHGRGLPRLRLQTRRRSTALTASEFEAAFDRERSLSRRGRGSISMLTFTPKLAGDEALEGLARLIHPVTRCADVLGFIDRHRMALLLPATGRAGGCQLADRLQSLLAREGLSVDISVFADDDHASRDSGQRASSGRRDGDEARKNGRADKHDVAGRREAQQWPTLVGRATTADLLQGPASESEFDELDGELAGPEVGRRPGHSDDGSANGSLNGHAASDSTASAVGHRPTRPMGRLCDVLDQLGGREVQDIWPMVCTPTSWGRRLVDIVVASVLLLLFAPLLAAAAIAIKLSSPGPVFFFQQRAGLGGRPFTFVKFRSMYVDAEKRRAALEADNERDGPIFKIKNDPRLTPIGRFLRRSSIDELPQLWNVLRGDMTLIGPRPPTLNEVQRYEPWQRDRLSLPGGLTCIWQVSGRSDVGFVDWVRMDLRYAQQRSLLMDLSLLLRTVKAVATGRGAY